MAEPETDFAPLLPVGVHTLTVDQLRDLCVLPFPTSLRRRRLMSRLEEIVRKLEAEHVRGYFWIDGSFLTDKIEPNDVDVVLVVNSSFLDNATTAQQLLISWVASNLKETLSCDSYFIREYPVSHRWYYDGEESKLNWLKQFGNSRVGTIKGIAAIELKGGPN